MNASPDDPASLISKLQAARASLDVFFSGGGISFSFTGFVFEIREGVAFFSDTLEPLATAKLFTIRLALLGPPEEYFPTSPNPDMKASYSKAYRIPFVKGKALLRIHVKPQPN
jgi:hypothetical protein